MGKHFMKILLSILVLFMVSMPLFAQDSTDESAMFSDTNSLVDTNKITDNSMISNQDKKSVNFTGQLVATTGYMMSSDWLKGNSGIDKNSFLAYMQGNLFLDVRMMSGLKVFANLALAYSPQQSSSSLNVNKIMTNSYQGIDTNLTFISSNNNTLLVSLQEIFIDININRAVYFRAGKQALSWGVSYFWNPSDLINRQKLNILNLSAYRDGVYGLKMSVPFGTIANFYSFVDLTGLDANHVQDAAWANKVDFMLFNTEIALAAWVKNNNHPVYSADFTTRFFGVDFYGEAYFADYDMTPKVSNVTYYTFTVPTVYPVTNQFVTKISVGVKKSFELFNIPDRLTLQGEFYYNSSGYTNNVFKDKGLLGTMMISNLYVPNYNSMYYAAAFITCSDFFNPSLSFGLNGIMNLNDASAIIIPSLTYSFFDDFFIALNLAAYIGADDTEYSFKNNGINVYAMTTVRF